MSAIPNPVLDPVLVAYRDRRPSKSERRSSKVDGSEMELQIVTALKRAGVTDEGVFAYFDHYRLPRYTEEGRSRSWLQSLIKTAVESNRSYVSKGVNGEDQQQHTRVIGSEHNRQKQSKADGVLVHLVLRRRVQGEADGDVPIKTEWWREIIEVSTGRITKPVSLSTARRMSEALIEQGYVRLEPLNKKSDLVYLTPRGQKAAELVKGKWGRFINLHPLPDRVSPVEPETTDTEPESKPVATSKPKKRRASGAKRRPKVATVRRKQQINGRLRLTFGGNKIRYFQLLTPPDSWVYGPVWVQLCVGYDENHDPIHLTVLSDDADQDEIGPLLPKAWKARTQRFAAGIELVRTKTGFDVAEYVDENGEVLPRVGVIVQSDYNFFERLRGADPVGRIVQVQGEKKLDERMYSFRTVGDAIPTAVTFDLASLLDDISGEAAKERILQLPSGWFHMPPKRQRLVQQLLAEPTG